MLAKKSIVISQALFFTAQFLNNTKTPDFTLPGVKSGAFLLNY